ncbi:MAG: transcriptional regulator [Verrucomicrobiales bacterium]
MEPKILRSPADHEAALARVEALMDAAPDSAEEAELELWALLIEHYESTHCPVPPPDPVDAIRFRMDQLGLKPKDLTRYVKSKSKVSEILSRKRPLSLNTIRALHRGLGISAETLVQEPPTEYRAGKALKK